MARTSGSGWGSTPANPSGSEPRAGGGGMVGIDINQAARVAAVAHGGQILMSDATSGLLVDAPAARRHAA